MLSGAAFYDWRKRGHCFTCSASILLTVFHGNGAWTLSISLCLAKMPSMFLSTQAFLLYF